MPEVKKDGEQEDDEDAVKDAEHIGVPLDAKIRNRLKHKEGGRFGMLSLCLMFLCHPLLMFKSAIDPETGQRYRKVSGSAISVAGTLHFQTLEHYICPFFRFYATNLAQSVSAF